MAFVLCLGFLDPGPARCQTGIEDAMTDRFAIRRCEGQPHAYRLDMAGAHGRRCEITFRSLQGVARDGKPSIETAVLLEGGRLDNPATLAFERDMLREAVQMRVDLIRFDHGAGEEGMMECLRSVAADVLDQPVTRAEIEAAIARDAADYERRREAFLIRRSAPDRYSSPAMF